MAEQGRFSTSPWGKQAHFDSRGLLHGAVGYTVAKKNPFEWEARSCPDGVWVDCLTWKDWAENGVVRVTLMSFRRATHVKPITHEELNA